MHHDIISGSGITAGNQLLRTQGLSSVEWTVGGGLFCHMESFKPRLERSLARAAAERIYVYWSARAQTVEMPFLTVRESRSPRPGVGRFGFLCGLSSCRCGHLLLFPHVAIPHASLCVHIPPSYKNTSPVGLGLTLTASFSLNPTFEGVLLHNSYILRCLGLGLRLVPLRELQFSPEHSDSICF